MVFVTAGEGGDRLAALVVAGIAREVGASTVGIVTMPFRFEVEAPICRRRRASTRSARLRHGGRDPERAPPRGARQEHSMLDAFKIADDVLRQGVQGICDLITEPGLINVDFADVRTIMQGAGTALMGIGFATGENRAVEAAERALRSPLVDTELVSAKGTARSPVETTSFYEVNEAAEVIRSASTDETNIIFGATVDERLEGQVWVTVVVTGVGQRGGSRPFTPRLAQSSTHSDDPLEPPSFLQS